jgi:GT2 family glycosyltransferase
MAPSAPSASIVIPTRARLPYLEVALSSIAPQAAELGAELLVVDDAGSSRAARELSERFGARYEPHPGPLGLNVARNTGVEHAHGELVVFVDDDVRVSPDWLAALLDAAREHPQVDVFTGPIRARLEGRGGWGSHTCGRERPPITTLELGPRDTDASFAWGANMAIRRAALERVGPFDASLEHGGDEQEWQERLRASTPGARVLYVVRASVEHRRVGADAGLRSLSRAGYTRGRAARRFDARRGRAPSLGKEALTLGGCLGHVVRRRCPAGLTMVAHSWGRLRQGMRERAAAAGGSQAAVYPAPDSPKTRTFQKWIIPNGIILDVNDLRASDQPGPGAPAQPGAPPDDFLSGSSGTVGGLDAVRRETLDTAIDAWELLSARRVRLGLTARHAPPLRRVLALGIERPERRALASAIQAELLRSRHDVELHTRAAGDRGKFENLNLLLAAHGRALDTYDWLLVFDDDVELPRGFLDRFLFLCERFSLTLAQPAHRLSSHAAWSVTRRRARSVVRETAFVEIGPVTAFASRAFGVLLPFPELRMGWGLDVHWAAVAREHAWRCGVLDAVAVRHGAAPAAAAYARVDAIAEARSFLAERPYLSAREADRTLTTHHSW